MIEQMNKVTIFSLKSMKEETIDSLRDLGTMHIESLVMKSEGSINAENKKNEILAVYSAISERRDKKVKMEKKSLNEKFDETQASLFSLLNEEKEKKDELIRLNLESDRLSQFGNLSPSLVDNLKKEGFDLHFYSISEKDYIKIKDNEDFTTIVLRPGKIMTIMSVNSEIVGSGASEFYLGSMSLDEVRKSIDLIKLRLSEIDKTISSYVPYLSDWEREIKLLDEKILFENVKGTANEDGEVLYITGYIPSKLIEDFKAKAKDSGWAYLINEIQDEDNPPTLVKYPGFVRIVKPVFDILGVVPGYREYDISVYFLLFFSLFFAMIIGDAGYGLIFLLVAIFMNIKSKKVSDLNILVYVLSITTMVWGALTGTYFGSEKVLTLFPFLQKLIIPAITNFPDIVGVDGDWAQNMVMKFCFILGAAQLSLACVLNIIHKAPKKDLSWLSDLGWLIDVLVLYMLVLNLVIGESCPFGLVAGGVATGFILVCCFGSFSPGISFKKGLLSSLGGIFTNFLNTVSCFSNIMSYIRLFAVGMASLAIAQSFNDMGAGIMPLGLIVIFLGHALNLVMGLLSVVVHGVRLNLLEFSGQLGMEWSGYEYEPFKKASNE